MLRRPATAITLTTEDIAIYEDSRAREALMREQEAQAQAQNARNGKIQNQDPKAALKGQYADSRRPSEPKTAAERLGLVGGTSRG